MSDENAKPKNRNVTKKEELVLKNLWKKSLMATACFTSTWTHASEQAVPSLVSTLTTQNNSFATEIYTLWANQKPNENAMLSPYSISSALAMAYAGAKGNTAEEMGQALNFAGLGVLTHDGFSELNRRISASKEVDGYQLNIANRLWGAKGYPFYPSYLNLTSEYYGAGLKELDFLNAPEPARLTINEWVSQQTNEKIIDLIPEDALQSDTRLVLTNAVYFMGEWEHKFDEKFTLKRDFKLLNGQTVQAESMQLFGKAFAYLEDKKLDAKLIQLPYRSTQDGKSTSMTIVLPGEETSLEALEKGLDAKTVMAWQDKLAAPEAMNQVALTLPKWKVRTQAELSAPLAALGMAEAFDERLADFGQMADLRQSNENLSISAVVHETFIEVKEGGTEAAGATAVIIVGRTSIGLEPLPKSFVVDRPFMYFIQDDATGSVLFMGRVVDPRS